MMEAEKRREKPACVPLVEEPLKKSRQNAEMLERLIQSGH